VPNLESRRDNTERLVTKPEARMSDPERCRGNSELRRTSTTRRKGNPERRRANANRREPDPGRRRANSEQLAGNLECRRRHPESRRTDTERWMTRKNAEEWSARIAGRRMSDEWASMEYGELANCSAYRSEGHAISPKSRAQGRRCLAHFKPGAITS
jgi:hypothetical protein